MKIMTETVSITRSFLLEGIPPDKISNLLMITYFKSINDEKITRSFSALCV